MQRNNQGLWVLSKEDDIENLRCPVCGNKLIFPSANRTLEEYSKEEQYCQITHVVDETDTCIGYSIRCATNGETLEQKLAYLRKCLLDKEYPMALDELLGIVENLFEGDKEVSAAIDTYIDDYYKMFAYAERYLKIRDLIKEDLENEKETNAANQG